MFLVKHLWSRLPSNPPLLLLGAAVLFVVAFSAVVLTKYHFFLYNGLDLAIFNNSLWNLVHGHNLTNAIHPPSYWADHVSPWLLILALPYSLWSDPQLLLLLQIGTLAACVWPLYRISRNHLSVKMSCLLAGLWLVNPMIHNISLYEFSLVPWSMFFLLWTYYWYEQKNFSRFIIFSLLAISTREDIAIMLLGFSLLAGWDRRNWKWWLTPAALGLSWFAVTQFITSQVSIIGGSKFLNFYSWIWHPSVAEILRHIVNIGNVQIVLGLLLPLLFLPLLKPRVLLLTLIPLAILRLGSADDGAPILRAHYGGLLLWPLFIAAIHSLAPISPPKLLIKLANYRSLVLLSLVAASVYACLTYGVIVPFARYHWDNVRRDDYVQALRQIPASARVATTYAFLTPLSSRAQIQLLPYAYANLGQFALTQYPLDPATDYLVIDWQDWLIAQIHYPDRYPHKTSLATMTDRWRSWQTDYQPSWQHGSVMVLKRNLNPKALASITEIKSPTADSLSLTKQEGFYTVASSVKATSSLRALQIESAGDSYYLPLAYGLWTATSSAATIGQPVFDSNIKKVTLVTWDNPHIVINDLNFVQLQWDHIFNLAESNVLDR